MSTDEALSESILKYRIRAQIIWYLETASSAHEQQEYERKLCEANAPGIVPIEMINQWEDWVRIDDIDWYCEPEFSADEKDAIRGFHEIWNHVVDSIPDPIPSSIDELIETDAWQRLMTTAAKALLVFMVRGQMLDRARFGEP